MAVAGRPDDVNQEPMEGGESFECLHDMRLDGAGVRASNKPLHTVRDGLPVLTPVAPDQSDPRTW